MLNPAAEHYLNQHRALADALPGRGLDWLQAERDAGVARFAEVGLPTRRDEDWRYTPVTALTNKKFHGVAAAPSTDMTLTPPTIAGMQSHRLVFVDGLFAPHLSDADARLQQSGVTVASLATVLNENPALIAHTLGTATPRDRHGFTALNNASSRDGAVVHLADGVAPTAPLELLFVSAAADAWSQPRNLVVAGDGARVSVVERHASAGDHAAFTNSATEVIVGERAEVDYYLVQTQSPSACHVCGVWAKQARASRFTCRTVTVGGALVRNDLAADLAGEHAHCDMLGLYHPVGAQHFDNHTTMTHSAQSCSSRELYKGVLDGRSRAVFHGRIKVQPGAQKTDAAQTNNNLLLSKHAEIDTKPQLEIYADDVKCSHGATVGRLDDDALFYLRARGIDAARAKQMLTFAFVGDVVNEIGIAGLKDALTELLTARLGGVG